VGRFFPKRLRLPKNGEKKTRWGRAGARRKPPSFRGGPVSFGWGGPGAGGKGRSGKGKRSWVGEGLRRGIFGRKGGGAPGGLVGGARIWCAKSYPANKGAR